MNHLKVYSSTPCLTLFPSDTGLKPLNITKRVVSPNGGTKSNRKRSHSCNQNDLKRQRLSAPHPHNHPARNANFICFPETGSQIAAYKSYSCVPTCSPATSKPIGCVPSLREGSSLGTLPPSLVSDKVNQRTDAAYVLSLVQKLFNTPFYIERPRLIRAKIPILKFRDRVSGVRFDLNFNNILSIRNTYFGRMPVSYQVLQLRRDLNFILPLKDLGFSLKEVVQDSSVKPKFQCLIVDPSFSMVTIQSEDSGIVWETASSRCSTPWASEGSSPSEQYSMEGSVTQGNIVIIMDEEKIRRKNTSSTGKLVDRFKISSSRLPKSPIGEERPAMTEVSVPNIRSENLTEDGLCVEDNDQNLFCLISEGFEILNIVVPSKLSTVDEEDSTKLTENLSYLEDTPKIKSRLKQYEDVATESFPEKIEINIQEIKQNESLKDSPLISADKQYRKDETHMDYLEKFTLLDQQGPGDSTTLTQRFVLELTVQPKESQVTQNDTKNNSSDDKVFATISSKHLEISGEHLDEVFYGSCYNADSQEHEYSDDTTKTSSKTLKDSGSALFGSQECILIPIFLPTGPPKIIDPILLEEPQAMSFHYSDLYEDAVGDRRKEDDLSDTESIVSERSFKRRYSDSDDADGYLEKFTLKDETQVFANVSEGKEELHGGKLAWSQNKFELIGCLASAKEENDEASVSQSCVKDKNESISEEHCKSTGCCSQEHCATEVQPRIAMVIRGTLTSEDLLAKNGTDFGMQCNVTAIANSITTNSDPYDTQPQTVAQVLESEGKTINKLKQITQKHSEQGQIKQALTADIQMPDGSEYDVKIEDEFEILPEKIQADASDAGEKNVRPEDGVGKHDVFIPINVVEIQQTSITTKENRGKFDQTKTQCEVLEPNIATNVNKDINKIVKREAPEIFVQEIFCFKEPLLDEAEGKAEKIPSFKVEEEVKLSKSTEKNTFVQENGDFTAIYVDKVSDVTSNAVIHIMEKQEQRQMSTGNESVKQVEFGAYRPTYEVSVVKQSPENQEQNIDMPVIESEFSNKLGNTEKIKVDFTKEAKQEANITKEPFYVEILDENRGIMEGEKMVDSSQQYSLTAKVLSIEMESLAEKPAEIKRRLIETTEDLPKVSLLPVMPAKGEEHSEENNVITSHAFLTREIPVTDTNISTTDIENKMLPVALTEMVAGKSECKLKKAHLNNAKIEYLPETISPYPSDDKEDSTAMRVSLLEPKNSKKVYKNIDRGRSLRSTKGIFSQLQSFAHQEDLSNISCDPDLQLEIARELDFEMATEQEARQSESATAEDKEKHYRQGQLSDQTLEMGFEFVEDLNGAKILEHEHQEEIEIQPKDAFCLACCCPILLCNNEHQNHEMTSMDEAFDSLKNELSEWISVLQGRSEDIEDFVSELELAYNTVEENFSDCEKIIKEQNNEVVKLLMEQYNEMSQAMEEQKKAKLEQLYDQIVLFQENIDKAKETMENAAKDTEDTDHLEFISSLKDINMRLKTALESTTSLELGPQGLLVLEDYARGKRNNEKINRQAIPVPKKPHLQPQEANSATSTSVTVYWKVSENDIIDCFQVYCMEEPQRVISEEYRVTVKESYCNLEELEPDKCYKVWVMAVNYTGCSMPSERLTFRTAPSVPVIQTEQCTVLWDSVTLRWSAFQPSVVDSFTLEYCRQYACEREGLRSISGIKGYEQKVLLQPSENYLFYIKSVNAAGASEQSEAALISTRGTKFHLLSEIAHTVLKVSADRNSIEYPHNPCNILSSTIECQAVMGELLPSLGYYYWETDVSRCNAYCIGIAYQTGSQTSTLRENSASWCLHCVPTSISCRFELLHDSVESDIFVMDVPARIGTLLDYNQRRLFFFNAQNGQLLGTFQHNFTQPCYPVFSLEQPGNLDLKMTMDVPEFLKHC